MHYILAILILCVSYEVPNSLGLLQLFTIGLSSFFYLICFGALSTMLDMSLVEGKTNVVRGWTSVVLNAAAGFVFYYTGEFLTLAYLAPHYLIHFFLIVFTTLVHIGIIEVDD